MGIQELPHEEKSALDGSTGGGNVNILGKKVPSPIHVREDEEIFQDASLEDHVAEFGDDFLSDTDFFQEDETEQGKKSSPNGFGLGGNDIIPQVNQKAPS